MNPREAAHLLGHCAAFDNRKPSQAAAMAWAAALHDVPLDDDAKAAVAAYYTTAPKDPDAKLWILPHHVRTLRSKIRSARLENFQYEPLPDETPAEFLARYRGQVQAIASGRVAAPTGRLALEGGPSREFMAELEARGWQGNRTVDDADAEPSAELVDTVRRSGPLGVICPMCAAEIGFPCKSGHATKKHPLGRPLAKPHTARIRAAAGEEQATPEQRAAEEQRVREASARALARIEAEQDIPDAEIVDEEAAS
ncbi:zinc finger domain-containing protein [Streptomyces iakyrus]|uniref:zinc finger domain-containing protein n=1 Tax=Streptomyces iakyrus TaxID=68219 RepID=UPI00367638FD